MSLIAGFSQKTALTRERQTGKQGKETLKMLLNSTPSHRALQLTLLLFPSLWKAELG